MRPQLLFVVLMLGASILPTGDMRAAGCDPDGNVKFICGIPSPEDLVAVPRSDWVLVSGYAGGGIYLVSTRDYTTTRVFPSARPRLRPDTKAYASCPGPVDPAEGENFRAHGLNVRPGTGGVHTVYVVHHGLRESVEIFEIDTKGKDPSFTWIGCVVAPDPIGLNSVSPLPEDGFAATNFANRGGRGGLERLSQGGNTGEVWEWHPKDGWKIVPGSESQGPNGIEASKDGKWFYVNLWPAAKVMRLSRGQTPVKKDVIDLPFQPDNLRWQPDGSLFAAGHGGPTPERIRECLSKVCSDATTNVAKIDPQTLKVREMVRLPAKDVFFAGTSALQVGKEIWIGTIRGDRIARYPIQ